MGLVVAAKVVNVHFVRLRFREMRWRGFHCRVFRGGDRCLQVCLLLRNLLHLLLNMRGGADCMLRGMLGECGLLLRGHGNFRQSLLVLTERLRDARVDFHWESDGELSELCDDKVNFAFEL